MASTITQAEFKEALGRYPNILKSLSKPPKEGSLTLEELDKFRYISAPMAFSKNTGRTMELNDLKKLIEWKMRHGTWRPTLTALVNKNSNEKIATTLKDAFAHYSTNKDDIAGTLERIAKPLSGIGPAAGSLILAIHDPQEVVYFSDELYRWLLAGGKKVSPKYTTKEFTELFSAAKSVMDRIKCTPIELEKAAFVLVKENDPVYEPAPKKEPSGKPRGRPAKPDSEKKAKVPSGRGRGRPAGTTKVNGVKKATPKTENQPDSEAEPKAAPTAGKKRGRPAKVVAEEEVSTPATKKRKTAPDSAKSSGRKAKA